MAANKLTMNQNRTKTTVFSSKKLKPMFKFRGSVLKTENDVRYLGVQIDRNLSLTEHLQNLKNRCAKFISFLYQTVIG